MKRWIVCGALAMGLFIAAAAQADKKDAKVPAAKPAEKAPAEKPAAEKEPAAKPAAEPAPEEGSAPKISPEKLKLITQVQDLDGSGDRAKELINDMKNSMRQQMNDLPKEFWDILNEEMNLADLVALEAQLYDLQYTSEDLQGLIKFYQTPLGKKVATSQPAIERDSFAIAQDWGRSLLNRAGARFQAKFGKPGEPGTEPAPAGAPAAPGLPQ